MSETIGHTWLQGKFIIEANGSDGREMALEYIDELRQNHIMPKATRID